MITLFIFYMNNFFWTKGKNPYVPEHFGKWKFHIPSRYYDEFKFSIFIDLIYIILGLIWFL